MNRVFTRSLLLSPLNVIKYELLLFCQHPSPRFCVSLATTTHNRSRTESSSSSTSLLLQVLSVPRKWGQHRNSYLDIGRDYGWISTERNERSGQFYRCGSPSASSKTLPFASDQLIHIHYNLELGAELFVNISHCNKMTVKVHYFSGEKNGMYLILAASVVYWCIYKSQWMKSNN